MTIRLLDDAAARPEGIHEAKLVPSPSGPYVVPRTVDDSISRVRLSLVVPTYNESRNIVPLIEQLEALMVPVLGEAYEIIVVDDDSPDRTWALALEASASRPHVRVVRRQRESGLSTAVIRGWQVARGDVLGVIDADLQHPPEVTLELLAEIDRGADLAVASRHAVGGGLSDWSFFRRVASRGAQLIGLVLLPAVLGRVSDPMSGYFMVRRSAVGGVKLDPLGYKILIEVVARADIQWIGEVGYIFRERLAGESKVTSKIYIEYLRHLLRLRWATLRTSRFVRFCIVGASGVLVDMILLYVLSDPRMLNLGLTRSKLVSAETAIVSNFLLNDAWTFRDVAVAQTGVWAQLRRFLVFNAICSAGLALNVVLLNVLVNIGHLDRYLANALAILLVTGWNFWLNRKLNWTPMVVRKPSVRAAEETAAQG